MRSFIAAVLTLSVAAPGRVGDPVMDEASRKATARALEWLAAQQNQDGSWGKELYPHNTAVTAFALLAFLSQGHLPGQGLYGPEVAKGARFLVASARYDGYLIGSRGGNMYAHAMAMLALAELSGMSGNDEDIRKVLGRATALTVGCQTREGGWRYDPEPTGDDISSTIMQVMALRAAKNSGLHVPDETIHRAIEYIKLCYDPDSGGYRYQPGVREPLYARTAAGVCVLFLTGKYDAKEITRAIEFMELLGEEDMGRFWYGQYYAAHAMHQVGGTKWNEWYTRTSKKLLARQSPDGHWDSWKGSDDAVGPEYRTAIGVTILSVPLNYLPIFQR